KEFECKGKLQWPELIGVPTKLAKGIIEKQNSLITNVQILLNGSPVTLDILGDVVDIPVVGMDYRCNRVRLFDNILGNVVQIPRVA
nr:chymotrypsin inhibitor I chain C - potato [Solanum tuberosum]